MAIYISFSKSKTPDPIVLEEYIISAERHDEAPIEAREIFDANQKDQIPTAIVNHPEYGWFVLESTGQGPYIILPE